MMKNLRSWILTIILTGFLSGAISSAKGSEVENYEVSSLLKPIKKNKKKRFTNKVANKARRSWYKN